MDLSEAPLSEPGPRHRQITLNFLTWLPLRASLSEPRSEWDSEPDSTASGYRIAVLVLLGWIRVRKLVLWAKISGLAGTTSLPSPYLSRSCEPRKRFTWCAVESRAAARRLWLCPFTSRFAHNLFDAMSCFFFFFFCFGLKIAMWLSGFVRIRVCSGYGFLFYPPFAQFSDEFFGVEKR